MSARLRKSTLAFFDMQQKHSDPEDVDLAHAGLYLVGAQVIACVLLLSVTATACSWAEHVAGHGTPPALFAPRSAPPGC